jgi:hypothetical protein
MLDNLTRNDTRGEFYNTWQKVKNNQPLSTAEYDLNTIMQMHPKYHHYLNNPEKYLDFDFLQEGENPFLHMAMHQALLEQLRTDRPKGIRNIHQKLLMKGLDPHEAEHELMKVLTEVLWEVLREGLIPNDAVYLEKLNKLLK